MRTARFIITSLLAFMVMIATVSAQRTADHKKSPPSEYVVQSFAEQTKSMVKYEAPVEHFVKQELSLEDALQQLLDVCTKNGMVYQERRLQSFETIGKDELKQLERQCNKYDGLSKMPTSGLIVMIRYRE